MCINDNNTVCKQQPLEDIYELMNSLIVTKYILKENLDLANVKNSNTRPLKTELMFSD